MGVQERLFFDRAESDSRMDDLLGPVVGEFVLREVTRAGSDQYDEQSRATWTGLPIPLRKFFFWGETHSISVHAFDALATLRKNLEADAPGRIFWEQELGDASPTERIEFDANQGDIHFYPDVTMPEIERTLCPSYGSDPKDKELVGIDRLNQGDIPF